MLDAGMSTQATFLGRRERTFEALYVSRGLSDMVQPVVVCHGEFAEAVAW